MAYGIMLPFLERVAFEVEAEPYRESRWSMLHESRQGLLGYVVPCHIRKRPKAVSCWLICTKLKGADGHFAST